MKNGMIDSQIMADRARAESAARLVQQGIGINPEYVSLVEAQKPKAYEAGTGVPYGSYPISGGLLQMVKWDEDAGQWNDFGQPQPFATSLYPNANYVSETVDQLPDFTGARAGAVGLYEKSDGTIQPVRWDGSDAVEVDPSYVSPAKIASLVDRNYLQRSSKIAGLPAFQKVTTSAPLFDATDTPLANVFWPSVIRVDDILPSPLGRYYMYFSTDHDPAAGGIGLAYADALEGPWTVHGSVVFQDTTEGNQTETPSVLWNEQTGQLHLYYHNSGIPSAEGNRQITKLATSGDGISWTIQGRVLEQPDTGYGLESHHTGYARIYRIQNLWVALHTYSGGPYNWQAASYSLDGVEWNTDPRPVLKDQGHLDFGNISLRMILKVNGRYFAFERTGGEFATQDASGADLYAGAVSEDFRNFISPPEIIVQRGSAGAWDEGGIDHSFAMIENNRIYIFYKGEKEGTGGGIGLIKSEPINALGS